MNNKTFRIFSIVCYDNSDTLVFNEIFNLCNKNNLNYFYIKHLKENEESKDHYHFMIYFDKPTTINKLSLLLNIPVNYIKVLDDFGNRYTLKKTIGYFLHYNNKDKINYDLNDIITNREDILEKYYNILTGGKNEKNELNEILIFIEDNKPNSKELLKFCIDNDYLKCFKKYSYVLYHICMYER